MPSIKRILFPVDFSPACVGAARYVEEMAGRFQASIRLIHVVTAGEHNLAEELFAGRKARLDAFFTEELRYFDMDRVCVVGDDPAAQIEEAARNWEANLVMIPTHGLGAFRRLLLGSVTAKVLHDLQCPVWTSVHAESAPALEDIHCRTVLCAVDLEEGSKDMLAWASWFAGEHDAKLMVVHASPRLPPPDPGTELSEAFLESTYELAQQGIDKLRASLNIDCEAIVRSGDPASIVSAAVKSSRADLLILGRYRGEALIDQLLENAYGILRRAPCPAITI